ncbi:MAG: DNA-3-methyladenine glycosylase I [Alphaproteobacteria bacterium]|nr:DNA-3-methyladenine glycosylase I [Alphaproteobacteria bacterium]
MKRCSWVDLSCDSYIKYHDEEWGKPVYDDRLLFEKLCLEGFQAGLSWITVLKKREAFKNAFDNFNAEKIAKYDCNKIELLMKNKSIIRHRLKIKAVISNAQKILDIQKEFGSFSNYLWSWTDNKIVQGDGISNQNELSKKISKDLKLRKMKYVGSVIIYSYLQAVGIINDHQKDCFLFSKHL